MSLRSSYVDYDHDYIVVFDKKQKTNQSIAINQSYKALYRMNEIMGTYEFK